MCALNAVTPIVTGGEGQPGRFLRPAQLDGVVNGMTGLYWIALIVAIALFCYLLVALLRPEKF